MSSACEQSMQDIGVSHEFRVIGEVVHHYYNTKQFFLLILLLEVYYLVLRFYNML